MTITPPSGSRAGFTPKQVALRTAALILAISVTGDPAHRGKQVAAVHQLARTVVSEGLRVTFDGDRYYLTKPADPSSDSAQSALVGDGVLHVVGSADRLADLFVLVDQVTGRG